MKELSCKLFVRYGDFSELKARNLTFQYARSKDVIICGSDLMVIGAMWVLIEMDIFRPVCGFDELMPNLFPEGENESMYNTVEVDFVRKCIW